MTDAANEPRYLTLEEWAAGKFRTPPSKHTLLAMARGDQFDPPAVKLGKAYYVEAGARVIDPNRRPSLVERMKQRA